MSLPATENPLLPSSGNDDQHIPINHSPIIATMPAQDNALPANGGQACSEDFLSLLRCNDNTDEYD